jgi:hypothetical protein
MEVAGLIETDRGHRGIGKADGPAWSGLLLPKPSLESRKENKSHDARHESCPTISRWGGAPPGPPVDPKGGHEKLTASNC